MEEIIFSKYIPTLLNYEIIYRRLFDTTISNGRIEKNKILNTVINDSVFVILL